MTAGITPRGEAGPAPRRRFPWMPLAALGLLLQGGCSSAGYYLQSASGHLGLMARREPISALLEDAATPPRLRARLALANRLREFASADLALPDNGSYRSYVATGRAYVVWNVVAAPEFSLRPERWCFLVVGCVSYRGYYDRDRADAFARSLRARGFDVYTAGVRAYSTLGWFDDPVLDTMLGRGELELAAVIFHELAHQVSYVKDDTAFNEAFAVTVEREGLRRWLAGHAGPGARAAYARARRRRDGFVTLVLGARARLAALYRGGSSREVKRERKREILERLRADYRRLRASWSGWRGYDAWFAHDLNNAKLASVATYRARVPAFARLLAGHGGDLAAFYRAVEALAALPREDRDRALDARLSARRGDRADPVAAQTR